MLVSSAKFFNSGEKGHRKMPINPIPTTSQYFERPLKNNLHDLSFKGLSSNEENKKKKSINPTLALIGIIAAAGFGLKFAPSYKLVGKFKEAEFNKFTQKYIGNIGTELLENLKNSKLASKLVKVEGDSIVIYKKTVPKLIRDGLKYPFTVLPGDLLNGSVELLGKIKPLKRWSIRTLQKPLFRDIRQCSKIDAKVNALQGLFETGKDLMAKEANGILSKEQVSSEMFQKSVKMFDTMKYGAYDTKHERALNRLVSGLPPAIFLANDAYNLSRMMDDNSDKADKEKKTRFKQETVRILSSGYLTLITLGALNKFINNSKLGIMLTTAGTVLFTEMFSRLANGKHIKRLTPEEARRENEINDAPEKEIKPVTFKSNTETTQKADNKEQKPLLSPDTLLKASLVVIGAGFALKGFRKIPKVEEFLKQQAQTFKDFYKKLTVIKDYTIEESKFNQIVEVLEKNGFEDLAVKYKEVAKKVTKEITVTKGKTTTKVKILKLGEKDRRFAKPAVNFVIAPFKFAYKTVTFPYRLVNQFFKSLKGKPVPIKKSAQTISDEIAKKDVEVLAKTIESIGKKALKEGVTPNEFQSYVKDNILKAFNVTTMSNISNAELANLAKTSATAATLWFLMTDNYNMVMLKSNGNDKEGAETKFKERFVQEASRWFYQVLLIDLFNSTFRSQYNSSLLNMSLITVTNTTLGEILTRKSVGMPTGRHTRDELLEIEKQQNEATGFLKKYYNFMRRLTGKRSISSYQVKQEPVKTEKVPNYPPVFQSMMLK